MWSPYLLVKPDLGRIGTKPIAILGGWIFVRGGHGCNFLAIFILQSSPACHHNVPYVWLHLEGRTRSPSFNLSLMSIVATNPAWLSHVSVVKMVIGYSTKLI